MDERLEKVLGQRRSGGMGVRGEERLVVVEEGVIEGEEEG